MNPGVLCVDKKLPLLSLAWMDVCVGAWGKRLRTCPDYEPGSDPALCQRRTEGKIHVVPAQNFSFV